MYRLHRLRDHLSSWLSPPAPGSSRHNEMSSEYKLSTVSSTVGLPRFIKESSCPDNDKLTNLKQWEVTKDDETRSFFVYIPPQICDKLLSLENAAVTHQIFSRILIGIHGYGGQPNHEITKWHTTAVALQTIIIAPRGTLTESNGRLGWNANDCCGDPVTKNVDDLGFVYGLIDIVLDTLLAGNRDQIEHVHVIATGFSNGGFMSSLLGLQIERLPKLVGIVPTGGYQYELKLYNNLLTEALPLPMMAHHGGNDGVVKPDGCCNSGGSNPKSNCPLDIGINQPACTSVHTAFEEWTKINGCSSTSVIETYEGNTGEKRKLGERQFEHTCWTGNECQAHTELCVWTNEGHSWGWEFPGVELAQTWMEKVYLAVESKSAVEKEPVGERANSGFKIDTATALSISFVVTVLFALRYFVIHRKTGLPKRKNSEEQESSIQLGVKYDLVKNSDNDAI